MRILVVWLVVVAAGHADAETPDAVAKKIVAAQVAALSNNVDDQVLAKTFAPDAVIIVSGAGAEEAQNGSSMLKTGISGGTMQNFLDTAKLISLTAGGDAKVVWIAAEIELTIVSTTGPKNQRTFKSPVRLTELAVADGPKWKVVAALFGLPGTPIRNESALSDIDGATKADLLTRILVSPSAISNGLAKDGTAVVFGTDKGERGVGGPAAKKLADSWKPLKLEVDGKVREVRTATYGFVQANVNWVKPGGAPYRMRAFMIATPDPTGTWTIRTVHYAVP